MAAATEPPGDVAVTFEAATAPDGAQRTYRLGLPADYDAERSTPLVLNLHGANANPAEQRGYSQLPAVGAKTRRASSQSSSMSY